MWLSMYINICGKDIQGNAFSNMSKIGQAKLRIMEHLQKKSNFIGQRFYHFRHNWLNPKPKLMTEFFSTLIPAFSILRLHKTVD